MSNTYTFTNLQPYNSPWIPGSVITVGAYFNIANTVSAAGFTNGDTVTAVGLIPEGGVTVLQTLVCGSPGDTNGSPTATFNLGDSLSDTPHAYRYMTNQLFSAPSTLGSMVDYQNTPPTFVSGVQTEGVGYAYTTNENSNSSGGAINIVLTVTANLATAATTGVVYVYVTYLCTGDI